MPELRAIATDLLFPEGPVALAEGSVLVVEIARRCLTWVLPDRRKEIVATPGGGPEWCRDRPRRPLLRLQQRRLRVLLMRLIGSGRDSSGHGPGIGSGRGWR